MDGGIQAQRKLTQVVTRFGERLSRIGLRMLIPMKTPIHNAGWFLSSALEFRGFVSR